MNRNLIGSIYGMSSIKIAQAIANSCFWLVDF